MSWKEITAAYSQLEFAVDHGDPTVGPWETFVRAVNADHQVPYHLVGLLAELDRLASSTAREHIAILDHGCGGGLSLLYLAAIGYRNIRGIDVTHSNCERWNRLAAEILQLPGQRFFTYDGSAIPLADSSIDLVFSQQVLEHVAPAVLDAFYSEERRVLKEGGIALHGVPHRLVPYESHTRTWFAHWILPHSLWLRFLRWGGYNVATAESALYLRWPWVHKRMALHFFGDCDDRTADRLRRVTEFDYYDGPAKLRQRLARIIQLPFVGSTLCGVLRHFMMMDTVSRNVAKAREAILPGNPPRSAAD